MIRPRPHDIYTLILRDRATGSTFSDAYTDLDDACEAFDDLQHEWREKEFMGASHTVMHHPAAPGDTTDFDISGAAEQWRRDRAAERRHLAQERAAIRHRQAAE